jgi:hypothetical protein
MKLKIQLFNSNFYFFLLIIILILILTNFSFIKNLEYKKNKNIKMSEKSSDSRLIELEDISFYENKINSKDSNFFLVFYILQNKNS